MDSKTVSTPIDQQPSASAPNAQSKPPPVIFESLLLRLPKELRERIYEFVHATELGPQNGPSIAQAVHYKAGVYKPNVALLLTSRFVKWDVETFMTHYQAKHPLRIAYGLRNSRAFSCYGAVMKALSLGHEYDRIALSKLPPGETPANNKLDMFTEKMPVAALLRTLESNAAESYHEVGNEMVEYDRYTTDVDRLKLFYKQAILHLRVNPNIRVDYHVDEAGLKWLKDGHTKIGRQLINQPGEVLVYKTGTDVGDLKLKGCAVFSSEEVKDVFNKDVIENPKNTPGYIG
jgi:hypothetical protein